MFSFVEKHPELKNSLYVSVDENNVNDIITIVSS